MVRIAHPEQVSRLRLHLTRSRKLLPLETPASDPPGQTRPDSKMYKAQRRVQIDDEALEPQYDNENNGGMRLRPSESNVTEDQEPFMGVKVRRKTSFHREYKGDYIDIPSHPYLMKILQKQGQNSDYNILNMYVNICFICK